MMFSEEVVTYLAALYAELRAYEAKRRKAAELLAEDDTEYRQKVVAGWDHAIGVVKAKIAQEEEANHERTLSAAQQLSTT